MNSPLERRKVRLRGLRAAGCVRAPRLQPTDGSRPSSLMVQWQVKPRAVCGAFRRCCGGFSRSPREAAEGTPAPAFQTFPRCAAS